MKDHLIKDDFPRGERPPARQRMPVKEQEWRSPGAFIVSAQHPGTLPRATTRKSVPLVPGPNAYQLQQRDRVGAEWWLAQALRRITSPHGSHNANLKGGCGLGAAPEWEGTRPSRDGVTCLPRQSLVGIFLFRDSVAPKIEASHRKPQLLEVRILFRLR